MRIVIAPDKFKDCLDARAVAEAMAAGARRAAPEAEIDLCPMADGGEGTVEALVGACGGAVVTARVVSPLPERQVDATIGLLAGGGTAVIEMASASGLHLLAPSDRNPLNTTSFGAGQLIRRAAEMGCRRIILGIGGSATCDGGIGCLQACGCHVILDGGSYARDSEPLCGRDVEQVVLVKSHRGSPVDGVAIEVACDVTNPLCGPQGAAAVYGPQKGALPQDVERLDAALRGLAARLGREDLARLPGAGAAGGIGFGLAAMFGATLRSGVEIVIDATRLRERVRGADLCLSGEGRLDGQTGAGKTVAGVAGCCNEAGVPCVALAGEVRGDGAIAGLTAALSVAPGPTTLEQAMRDAPLAIRRAAEQVVRLWRARR